MNTALTKRSKGQALVLTALGMILLTLMVTMTLSFGTKAKAKMELQVVADQAAYSTAVATARTYNMLAMTNRVMVANMVAMLGVQSAISFATSYFVLTQAILLYYTAEIANQLKCCKWSCAFYGCFTAAYVFITRWIKTLLELIKLIGKFPAADVKAAAQARRTSAANNLLFIGQTFTVSMHLYGSLRDQNTARRVMARAAGTAPDWAAPSNAAKVTTREAGFIGGLGPVGLALGVGAINQTNLILTDRHAAVIAMGSRGHFWTSIRDSYFFPNGVTPTINQGLQRLGARNDWQGGANSWIHMGKGYFATFLHLDTVTTATTYGVADDHIFGIFRYSGPAARQPLRFPAVTFTFVMSNNSSSLHLGLASLGFWFDGNHMVPAVCLLNCPSAWTNFVDYNVAAPGHFDDNRGVPKAPVIINRNAGAANPDPFNLMFNFRFTPSGKTFDTEHAGPGGGIQVRDGLSGTKDISDQVGYSTGITYYHRQGSWREPPTLFNPFFRAGITRPDTDRKGTPLSVLGFNLSADNSDDIEETMRNGGVAWAAEAYEELYKKGYQGITP